MTDYAALGIYKDRTAAGWTTFNTPDETVYISDSTGSDASGDPTNPSTPMKRIPEALQWAISHGLGSGAVHFLMAKGDVWTDQTISEDNSGLPDAGGALGNARLFSSYDPAHPENGPHPFTGGAMPRIKAPLSTIMCGSSGGGFRNFNHLAFVGLDLHHPYSDPEAPEFISATSGQNCFVMNNNYTGFLVEGCRARGFVNLLDIGQFDPTGTYANAVVRRNVADNNVNGLHGTGNGLLVEENVFHHNGWKDGVGEQDGGFPAPNIFDHNVYMDPLIVNGERSSLMFPPPTIRGNIFCRNASDSQFRAGGQVYENVFIQELQGHNIGNPYWPDPYTNDVYNNVYMNFRFIPRDAPLLGTGVDVCGILPMVFYLAMRWNRGTTKIRKNIFAHTVDSVTQPPMSFDKGCNGLEVTQNKVYNWSPGNLSADAGPANTHAIEVYTGSLTGESFEITDPGAGYVPQFVNIIGVQADRDWGASNDLILISEDASAFNDVIAVWFEGVNGNGDIPSLNNKMWTIQRTGAGSDRIVVTETSGLAGDTWTSGGTQRMYFPYVKTPVVAAGTGPGTSGVGGEVYTIVGGDGSVKALHYSMHTSGSGEATRGSGFQNGDTCTIANSNLGGSGSGLLLTVVEIAENTIGGTGVENVLDPVGTNSAGWTDPDRDTGSYQRDIMEGSDSVDDFLDSLVDQHKGNWNDLKMAESVGDYMRFGYDDDLTGSAFADSIGAIILSSLPNGQVGVSYSDSAAASGGVAPYTYAVTTGSLPNGLSLNASTGAVTGTPTVNDTFAFTITATDDVAATGHHDYNVTIAEGVGGNPSVLVRRVYEFQ